MDETNIPNIESQNAIMNPEVENFLVHELTKEENLENEDKPQKIRKCLKKKSTKKLLISCSLLIVGLLAVSAYSINKVGGKI